MNIRLIKAGPDDIGTIMAIERLPGYEALVGRSTEEEHRRRMASDDTAHWLAAGEGAGDVGGFAIVTGVGDPHNGPYLRRIAVVHPGQGFGGALIRRLSRWAFEELKAPRFFLHVLAHNARAVAAYEACGFVKEGLLRSAYLMPDGTRADRVLMAIVAADYGRGSP